MLGIVTNPTRLGDEVWSRIESPGRFDSSMSRIDSTLGMTGIPLFLMCLYMVKNPHTNNYGSCLLPYIYPKQPPFFFHCSGLAFAFRDLRNYLLLWLNHYRTICVSSVKKPSRTKSTTAIHAFCLAVLCDLFTWLLVTSN